MKPVEDFTLENVVVADLIEFKDCRGRYLPIFQPSDFQSRYNRAVLYAMQDMTEKVDPSTIYRYLARNGWAIDGIAEHLAGLSSLIPMLTPEENPF